MRKSMAIAVLGAVAFVGVSACGNAEPGPESTESATQLKTYKVDGLPNVTTFCLGDLGYAMAIRGDDSVSLTRVYEKDTQCLNDQG